jgi:hypothetical protein
MTPPTAHTCALGLLLSTGTPGGWLATLGDGPLPPVPAHMTVIHEQSGPGWWYRSGTVGPGPYTTLLALAEGQTAHVRFVDAEAVYRCWTPPDADGDGAVDSRDISRFLGDWQRGLGDFNVDFAVTSEDIAAFLELWLEGVG